MPGSSGADTPGDAEKDQATKNKVHTMVSAMKNGIISAITVPTPDRRHSPALANWIGSVF